MKVAVIYNISENDLVLTSENQKENLNFEPYFDLKTNNPFEDFEAMAQSLRKSGFDAYTLNIKDSIDIFLDDYKNNCPDVVFNLVELFNNKSHLEMSFAGFLELLGVTFTGASSTTLGICQRKPLAKGMFLSLGVSTPKFKRIASLKELDEIDLKFPIIVKPSMEDASIGIENDSVVTDFTSLKSRVKYIFDTFNQFALIEEFIDGRELNVSVFGNKNPRVLPISEIDFSRMPNNLRKIVSYQAKWDPFHVAYHSTVAVCPAELPEGVKEKAEELAIKAYKAVGARDYARVDMRLSKDNQLYVLEVNPNPDLTQDAGFMRSAKAAGYSFNKTLKRIVEFAIARIPKEKIKNIEMN